MCRSMSELSWHSNLPPFLNPCHQTVSVLLNGSGEILAADGAGFTGKTDTLSLLGSLGQAVALGAEAGEDIEEVGTGTVDLKV